MTAPNVLVENTWQYLVATEDASGNVDIYVDGLLAATGTTFVPNALTRSVNYIGRSDWSVDALFQGAIDEVAIYPSALSASRIQAHFAAAGGGVFLDTWVPSQQVLGLPFRGNGGDPVDTGSGVYTYRKTDLAIAGRGSSPSFARAYNSAASTVGPLGPGWTHTDNIRIVRNANASLAVVNPNGRYDVYTPKAGGGFSPPSGVSNVLTQDPTTQVFTLTLPDQSNWTFTPQGQLITLKDRYGNTSNLTYNGSGELVSASDPAGRGSLTLAYDTCFAGRLCSVTDWQSPSPRSVVFTYDTSGRLSKVTDRDSQTTTYAYDGTSSRLTTITDANQHAAITNLYGTTAWDTVDYRVLTQKDALNNLTSFSYVQNPDQSVTTTVTYPTSSFDNFAPTVSSTYSVSGQLTTQVVTPSSTDSPSTTTYTYDPNGNLQTVKDPRGNVTISCYDTDYSGHSITGSLGNLTRVIAPPPTSGATVPVTLLKYDAKNNLIETIPPKGVSAGTSVTCTTDLSTSTNSTYATDNTFDASGIDLLSTTRRYTDPDQGSQTAVTSFVYGDTANPGRVTQVIPPRGNAESPIDSPTDYSTKLAYNGSGTQAGMLQSSTDPLGDVTTYSYDAVGRKVSVVDPNGNVQGGTPSAHTWGCSYDNEDRVLTTSAPAPQTGGNALVTTYTYDPVGNRTVVTDANGNLTRYGYDARDSLGEVDQSATQADPNLDPNKIVTAYAYDHLGNLSQVTRAKGDPSGNERQRAATSGRRLIPMMGWPACAPRPSILPGRRPRRPWSRTPPTIKTAIA